MRLGSQGKIEYETLYNLNMKKIFITVVSAFLCMQGHSFAAESGGDKRVNTKQYLYRVWGDLKELPARPLHWDKKNWLIAGAITGASISAFAVDSGVSRYYRDHKSNFLDSVSDITTNFGSWQIQVPLLVGLGLTGAATGDRTCLKIAADGAEASLFAAAIVQPAFAYAAGRSRPDSGEAAVSFKFFTPGRTSYPSGHTAEAFAVATVLDQNLRKHFGYWQTPLVYGFAAGTANSRIYDQHHYLSDVIMGAGLGWAIGYWVANKPRDSALTLVPQSNGLLAMWKF